MSEQQKNQQPAAAPTQQASAPDLWALIREINGGGAGPVVPPAPAPADERAAFPRYAEWLHLRTHGEWSSGVPVWARDHTGRMNDLTAASAVIEELAAARAASASETGAEGASVTTAEFEAAIETLRHVIHCLRQNGNYTDEEGEATDFLEPLLDARLALSRSPAMAAEAVAIGEHDLSTSAGGRGYVAEFFAKRLRRHDFGRYINERLAADFACALAQYLRDRDAAPQPAQAGARGELMDEQIDAIWDSVPSGDLNANSLVDLATLRRRYARALLAAHPGQPEPRAEVTLFADNDERDEFIRACQDFDDDGETCVDYGLLMKWASDGLLDCDHFTITKNGRAAIDAARAGGA